VTARAAGRLLAACRGTDRERSGELSLLLTTSSSNGCYYASAGRTADHRGTLSQSVVSNLNSLGLFQMACTARGPPSCLYNPPTGWTTAVGPNPAQEHGSLPPCACSRPLGDGRGRAGTGVTGATSGNGPRGGGKQGAKHPEDAGAWRALPIGD